MHGHAHHGKRHHQYYVVNHNFETIVNFYWLPLFSDFQQRAVWSRSRGEGHQRNRFKGDGGPPQQKLRLVRAARTVLQPGARRPPHPATQRGK